MSCYPKSCSPFAENPLVKRSLDLQLSAQLAKDYLKWGLFNALLLTILLIDLSLKCPFAESPWYSIEIIFSWITGLSASTCLIKYFLYLFRSAQVEGTEMQKLLLTFDDNDCSFVTREPLNKPAVKNEPAQVNSTIISWHSSFNDSRNGNWSYNRTTPPRQSLSPAQQSLQNMSWNSSYYANSSQNVSLPNSPLGNSFSSPYMKYVRDGFIRDENSLTKYLNEVSEQEKSNSDFADISRLHVDGGNVNSFWNYCNTAVNLLKTSVYQLAPITTPVSQHKPTTIEDGGVPNMDSNSEVIKRISTDKLSQYVVNLRTWIATTILQRLVKEIENVDAMFKQRGFIDMQIGMIGLERLKKTAENAQFVNQFMPRLPLLLPFLELSSNQEYLVQRVKNLAQGSCIADYRWNSGSEYNGQKWGEHLPSDSAILFHLFSVYLDSQLMPLPQSGGRPFSSRYVLIMLIREAKRSVKDTIAAVRNKARCAILCSNPLKPKFNFISDNEIHNCAYDRNNLFYVIIQFLIYMRSHQESSLEGVNLGKSGINIMCVIED